MKKINLAAVAADDTSSYPPPFDAPCNGQTCQRLARSQGLTLFGVNLTVIPPGGWSSQRHWHSHEDEFVWMVEGELTLVTNSGEEILRPGDCAAFKAGDPDGHHLVNKSNRPRQSSRDRQFRPPRPMCLLRHRHGRRTRSGRLQPSRWHAVSAQGTVDQRRSVESAPLSGRHVPNATPQSGNTTPTCFCLRR